MPTSYNLKNVLMCTVHRRQMAQCAHGAAGEGEGEGEAEADDAARGDVLALDADLLLDAPSVHLDQVPTTVVGTPVISISVY